MITSPPAAPAWTCPFCPLACDHLGVRAGSAAQALELQGGTCERASRALSTFASAPAVPAAEVDGRAAGLDAAIAAAAERLAASHQPLFAGLGTDVAGMRALYPLACATGAICDAAPGEALMHGLRALQDRGQFTTTLGEVRVRADLIVFIGAMPTALAPLIGQRLGIGDPQVARRHVVVIGPEAGDEATLAGWAGAGVSVETLAVQGDLFDSVALLDALVARRPGMTGAAVPEAWRTLAERLRAARYGVLIGTPSRLPAQGALVVEVVHRIVGELNRETRAAALWIGGGNGVATANQVFTWLSGLPLRSRAGPRGLEHEPLRYGGTRLIEQGAVDALLWVASFEAEAVPPSTTMPTIVFGHPALAAAVRRPGAVFIPVATPGIGCNGHVFRTDGTVLMPLRAVRPDGLPALAEVARRVLLALPSRSAA
ncbi:formylmethanofuran dehydrogenase [uncultured Piscinibacter sp.]|uniref:formylmethanofuran dehydrogenase n=1 Tax=uncultured Piscinibacter sp. TaxID=1131835 RepID=UPI00261EFBEB|nr:formylmethanofuran dehydrogenase [uncultured Piscinibacter sp.]